jgi:hypothetical protein
MIKLLNACEWIPMTEDDWDWVNGKVPAPQPK